MDRKEKDTNPCIDTDSSPNPELVATPQEPTQPELDKWMHDKILDAQIRVSCGIDLDQVGEIQLNLIKALKEQSKALKDGTYDSAKPDQVGRTTAYTAKALDGVTRMAQFAKGEPDSRPDMGTDWLRALTDAQLDQVAQWISQAQGDAGQDTGT